MILIEGRYLELIYLKSKSILIFWEFIINFLLKLFFRKMENLTFFGDDFL